MHFAHFEGKAGSVMSFHQPRNWALEIAAKEERMGAINDESRSRNCGYFVAIFCLHRLTDAYRLLV